MASRRTGRVTAKTDLTPGLTIFRIQPEEGFTFPEYRAGQYIALGRDDVPLTTRVGVRDDGSPIFGPHLDAEGRQKIGSVMHSYSVASAPSETARHGFLEFYVVQAVNDGVPGRLSTVLLGMPCCQDDPVNYVDRIVGHFTLEELTRDVAHVILVGTGTGLAPFASMVKELDHAAEVGRADTTRYTLLHTNRTVAELGYHDQLRAIEQAARFDFRYLPTVSRPADDRPTAQVGTGRANNLLRLIYRLPSHEEEAVAAATDATREAASRRAARATPAALPDAFDLSEIRRRFDGTDAVILTCGNPAAMTDIQTIAERAGVRSEIEPW